MLQDKLVERIGNQSAGIIAKQTTSVGGQEMRNQYKMATPGKIL